MLRTPHKVGPLTGSAAALTSRRGSWVALLLGLLVALLAIGGLRGESPERAEAVPATSESAQVQQRMDAMPGGDVESVLVVLSRADGAPLDAAGLQRGRSLAGVAQQVTGTRGSPLVPSSDQQVATFSVPLPADSEAKKAVTDLRERLSAADAGLDVKVTGGPAFGVDVAKAFDGANVTLLLVTIGIVALLLLLTYRSPVLWLLPLLVVGLADQLAAVVTGAVGRAFDLGFDAGIVSVLVFGAGTNYALLLISRYREELHHEEDHRAALATAVRATAPAIAASNASVVLSLLTLVLAVVPSTRAVGVASAVGLAIALVTVLLLLPAALALVGRRVFWPFVPRPGDTTPERSSLFGRFAERVMAHPGRTAAACTLLLATLALGLTSTGFGLSQTERFRTASESAAGLEQLAEHMPAGEAQPLLVMADRAHVGPVVEAARAVPRVTTVRPIPGAGQDALVQVITLPDPGTPQARGTVEDVRRALHAVPGARAQVGGAQAEMVDSRDASVRDLKVVVPLVLLVSMIVLMLLLRAVVAPVLLTVVTALSSLSALGLGAWLADVMLGWDSLDEQVPLLAVLFLVALGIDYSMFLVHRARAETPEHGTRDGMVRAVAATGTVITSAGVVLAAVFAALGVLPLVTLGQLGLVVGVGVVLDTFVARTALVPALAGLLGDRFWWPGRPGERRVS